MNRVLIAGGSGFIGVNLIQRFIKLGYQVFVLEETEGSLWRLSDLMFSINIIRVDFSDFKAIRNIVEEVRPEIVINTISYGGLAYERLEEKIYSVNYQGVANLLRACAKIGFDALINIGSSEEYGLAEGKIDEEVVPRPTTDYGVAKSMATNFALKFAYSQGLSVYCVRPFSVYGDFTPRDKLIGSLFVAAYNGVPVYLRSPEMMRDFLYIEDLIDMLMLICQRRPRGYHLFNAGSGISYKISEVAKKVEEAVGRKIEIEWGDDALVGQRPEGRFSDSSLAKRVLSWTPRYDLDSGIQATKKWFDKNISRYKTEDKLREIVASVL